jgi:hypothetical protein
MHLAALSAGGHAPRGRFNGSVHSVFRQACNVRLDDGRMLALLAPHLGNAPHGVRLDVPAGFGFADHLTVGQRVGCRADVLRVVGGLSIDLGTAQAWRGELPAAGIDLTNPKVARAWRAASCALQHGRPRADRSDFMSVARAVARAGVRLARATRVLQPDEAARAIDGLIGRGPGLTPSGDDLIIGFLAGLWSTTGDHPARRGFLEALCAAVAAAAAATGDISRAYLSHATQGRFAQPLTTLARRIAEGGDLGVVQFATTAALRVGHTSGADGVMGLLLGLAVWAPQPALSTLDRPKTPCPGRDWSSPPAHSLFLRAYQPAEAVDTRVEILQGDGCRALGRAVH